MIYSAIINAFREKLEREWDTLYFAVDLHGTIIEKYTASDLKPYEYSLQILRLLSRMPDVVLILFTSSYEKDLKPFYDLCKQNEIHFKYFNENPECASNKTGDFSKKFYYNVLIDDRAGFDPLCDWQNIGEALKIINS
jgi:hypothetical protein